MAPSNIHPCLLLLLVAFFTIAFNYGQAACVTKSPTPSPTAQPPLRSVFRTRKFAAPASAPFSRTHPMDQARAPEASSPQGQDAASPPEVSSPPETYSSSTPSLLLDTSAVTSSLSASMSSAIASISAPEASAPETPSPEASTAPGVPAAPETSSDTSPTASRDASAPTHPATSSSSSSSDTSALPGMSALDTPSAGTGGTGLIGDPELKRICDATDNPELCLMTISPFLSAGKADPMTVLRMAIKACMENARLALSTARTFAVGLHVAGDKDTASSLDTCKENYSDALDNLESALGAIEANDMGTMNSMLSAAVTDFGTCTDAFAESGASSPLASFDDKLAKMASNSLAIVSLIKQ